MKVFQLKDITARISTRDHGTQAAIKLFEILMSSKMIEYREEKSADGFMELLIIPDPDGAVIDIPENSEVSTSFLDEVIYRLSEQNQLHRFRFQIHDIRVYEKFQTISTDRQVPIGIIMNGEELTIKPSSKPIKKKGNIIYQDL